MTKLEKWLSTRPPVKLVIRISKRIYLPGFQGVPLYDVAKFFTQQVQTVGLNERAAAISFNFLMAIPATCIFLFTLIPYLPISKSFFVEMMKLVQNITPNRETRRLVVNFLDDFLNKPKTGLLSLGFLLAVFYSSNAMMGIIRTFDKSLPEKYTSNFIEKRWRAIKLTSILVALIVGTILISLGQGYLFSWLMKWLGVKSVTTKALIQWVRWIVVIFLFLYSIGLIYRYAPSVRKRWKIYSPGTITATTLVLLATMVFSYWVQNFSNYNKFYGSIGSILILMLLIYINSLILLIGFELNVSITALKRVVQQREATTLQNPAHEP